MRTALRRALCLALLSYAPLVNAQSHFADCLDATPTGTNASIIIPGEANIFMFPPNRMPARIGPGDELAVYSPKGHCVATAAWHADGIALAIWGDDPRTETEDGLLTGDTLSYRAWDSSAGKELAATAASYDALFDTSGRFSPDAVLLAGALTFGKRRTDCRGRRCRKAQQSEQQRDEAGGQEDALEFALDPNYPNPFADRTTLSFSVAEPGRVRLEVYDLLGRPVAVVVDEDLAPGRYAVVFEAHDLASGVYVARLASRAQSAVQRLQVVR